MSTTHVFWSNWLTRCIPLLLLFLENTSSSLWDIWKYYMFLCMLCKNFHLQLDNWTCQNLQNEAFTQRRKSQVKSLPCLSTSPHPAPCLSLTLFILQLLILILNKKKSGSFAAVSSYDGSASFNCRRELTGSWSEDKTYIWRKPTVFACDGSETHKTCFA